MNDLKTIDAVELYNLPLTEFFQPIVDCRPKSCTHKGHIPTSLLFHNFDSIESLFNDIDDIGFENGMSVILYGNDSCVDRDTDVASVAAQLIEHNRRDLR